MSMFEISEILQEAGRPLTVSQILYRHSEILRETLRVQLNKMRRKGYIERKLSFDNFGRKVTEKYEFVKPFEANRTSLAVICGGSCGREFCRA